MNLPSPISQVGALEDIRNRGDAYCKSEYGVVFYLLGHGNNKYFFEDLFIRLKISILSEK